MWSDLITSQITKGIMHLTIAYKEIEALMLAKAGLEIIIRCINADEIRFQPRNMGFIQNRVKVSIKLDREFHETNRLKFIVSAGVISNIVVPKVMTLLDYMPERCISRQDGGVVYVMLDKIPQLRNLLSCYELTDLKFYDSHISIDAPFSYKSGVNINDVPPVPEDSWSNSTNYKNRQIGNTFIGIARAIFESDKVDEGMQTLKDKAAELRDAHGEDLKNAALSFFKSRLRNPQNAASSTDSSIDE